MSSVPAFDHTADLSTTGGEAVKWARAIDAWTDAMRAAGLRPRTVELRRWQLRLLAEAHLRRSPWSVKTQDLIGWLQGHDWTPATRKSYRAALSSFYNWAERAGHVKRSPARDLPAVAVPRGVPRPTPDAVFEQALAGADDRTRLILILAAYAGLRRAEIAGLRWDHIADDEIRVIGKGGHVRLVPVHPAVAEALGAEAARREAGMFGGGFRYTSRPDSPWVFPGRNGRWATADSIGRAATRALGPLYGGHTLRHRFATRAYTNTHDLRAVQQLLGHASPTTTAIYAKADRQALRAAVHAL